MHQYDLIRWRRRDVDAGSGIRHQEQLDNAPCSIMLQRHRITAQADLPTIQRGYSARRIHHLGQAGLLPQAIHLAETTLCLRAPVLDVRHLLKGLEILRRQQVQPVGFRQFGVRR